ncbi:MAG: response regulator transcription factor [Planctomycetes bacterium]|nr:response regulator transcription factor [Planctomycetota bacterium]
MPHILVVEDEEHLAIGIKYNLEAEGFRVTIAGDGQTALAVIGQPSDTAASPALPATPPGENIPVDLVVLDLMLPGMSGYAVCEAIRSQGNDVPVVMLTARTLVEDRIRGFDAGTDVYLQKPFDLDELLSIVRNLLARRGRQTRPRAVAIDDLAPRAGDVYRFGTATVNFDTWEARSSDRPVRLTNLEMKLLRYLVEHEGTVLSRSDLLKRVWGMARVPATRTVDTFMLNLRKYFEEDPAHPVHFLSVRGMGYRFVGDQPTKG